MLWATALCLILSPLFAALESAVITVSRVRLHHAAKRSRTMRFLVRILDRPNRVLASILLVSSLSSLMIFLLLTMELIIRIGDWGYLIAFVAGLPLYLLFVELLPKAIVRHFPFRFLKVCVPLLALLYYVPGFLFGVFSRPQPAGNAMRKVRRRERSAFRFLTENAGREGIIGPEENTMILNILGARVLRARDVMTPIDQVPVIIPEESDGPAIAEISRRYPGESIFPVGIGKESVTGFLDLFQAFKENRKNECARELARAPSEFSPGDPLNRVRRRMRSEKSPLGIVRTPGEPKSVAGIVKLDDVDHRMLWG